MTTGYPNPIDALILDMDGVLWRDNQPMLDMPSFFSALARLQIKVVFATNNGTRSVGMYVDRLVTFGVSVEAWQVVNSSICVADYLSKRFPGGGSVFVVGEVGVYQALQEKGFIVVDDRSDPGVDAGVLAVVAGMDRGLSYPKMARAALIIRAGKPFIATNPDRTFPTPNGLVPGAGSIIALLEAATSIEPVMIGKPEPYMYIFAMERLGTHPSRTLAVGDRMDTDILGGYKAGCPTAAVLTGVTNRMGAENYRPAPDLILPNLADLLPILEKMKKCS